jgi:amino acid transporter
LINQTLLYPPQNWIRLVTGWGVGLLIAALIYPIFTQTVWQTWRQEAVLDRTTPSVIIVLTSLLILAGFLSGYPGILYPLAILSVVGVAVILTLIYTVVMLILFKQENRYNHFTEMTPVLLGGLLLTLTHIGLFDLVRYLLTETWSGLPL